MKKERYKTYSVKASDKTWEKLKELRISEDLSWEMLFRLLLSKIK